MLETVSILFEAKSKSVYDEEENIPVLYNKWK